MAIVRTRASCAESAIPKSCDLVLLILYCRVILSKRTLIFRDLAGHRVLRLGFLARVDLIPGRQFSNPIPVLAPQSPDGEPDGVPLL